MERLRFRSTSTLDLQAELLEGELLREARSVRHRPPRPARRVARFGLRVLARRLLG